MSLLNNFISVLEDVSYFHKYILCMVTCGVFIIILINYKCVFKFSVLIFNMIDTDR